MLLRGAAQVAPVLLGAAALGVLLVGVFPTDGNATVHAIGAVSTSSAAGSGLIALAYAVRPRSEVLGTTLALLGLVGTAATVFFLTGVTQYLGEGGTERVAAYALPLGLALAGVGVCGASRRRGPAPPRTGAAAREARPRAEQAEPAPRAGRRAGGAAARPAGRRRPTTRTIDDPWAGPAGAPGLIGGLSPAGSNRSTSPTGRRPLTACPAVSGG